MTKQRAKIDNWSIVGPPNPDPYVAPEARPHFLWGNVTGHPSPRVTPDFKVKTSLILKFDIENKIIETRNTIYELGTVDPGFIDHCFEAKSRNVIVAMSIGGFLGEVDEAALINVADKLKKQAFDLAEKQWFGTPDAEKKRSWPRCNDYTCNKTGVCKGYGNCSGFDH